MRRDAVASLQISFRLLCSAAFFEDPPRLLLLLASSGGRAADLRCRQLPSARAAGVACLNGDWRRDSPSSTPHLPLVLLARSLARFCLSLCSSPCALLHVVTASSSRGADIYTTQPFPPPPRARSREREREREGGGGAGGEGKGGQTGTGRPARGGGGGVLLPPLVVKPPFFCRSQGRRRRRRRCKAARSHGGESATDGLRPELCLQKNSCSHI